MKKLLIQACSGRKINASDPVAALDLYDGTAFRVIKKFLRENPEQETGLIILILSAEYGLISSRTKIAAYDRRMDRKRAEALRNDVFRQFMPFMLNRGIESIFINVGGDYLPALKLISFPLGTHYARGGIGYRNGQLKTWLNSI